MMPATSSVSPATELMAGQPNMARQLVLRGVLAGALAGLLAFVFARIFAEPPIQAAIDYEGIVNLFGLRRRCPPQAC